MLTEQVGSDSEKHFCIVLGEGSRLISQPLRLWTFGVGYFFVVGGCAVYCRVLYPVVATSTSLTM